MKKYSLTTMVLLSLMAFAMLAMTGCNGGKPEEVVANFFEHLYEQDYGSSLPYMTERCLENYDMFTRIRQDHDSGGNIWTESKIVVIEHGDNTTECYSQDNEELRVWLIRVNGKWMIDEFEYQRASSSDRDRDRDDEDEDRDEDEDDEDRNRTRDRDEDG